MSRSLPPASRRAVPHALSLAAALFIFSTSGMPASAQMSPQPRPKSEIAQAMAAYHLSTDDLQKVTVANDRLYAGLTKNPAAARDLMLQTQQKDSARLDDVVKRGEANPVVSSAIHSAGMDVRGYLVAMSSAVVAQAYSQVMHENPQMAGRMSGMLSQAQLENVKLIEAHPAEAKAFSDSLARLKQLDEEVSHANGSGGR